MPFLHCHHKKRFQSDKYVKILPRNGVHKVQRGKLLYEGEWLDGKRHGEGMLSIEKSNKNYEKRYDGEWKVNYKWGQGNGYYADGGYYEGEWQCSKRHGYGTMWYSDGTFYSGDWRNGKRWGEGIYVFRNGNRYEGDWENDKKHGLGIFFYLNTGQAMIGVWQNNKAITSIITDIPFRQTAIYPTQYPIPNVGLKEPDIVFYSEVFDAITREISMDLPKRYKFRFH